MTGTSEDQREIRALVEAYAAGVDARRAGDVAALFAGDGVLVTQPAPGAQQRETLGPERIERALAGLERYPATVHDVANHSSIVDAVAGLATAETSCFAHHLQQGDDGTWTDRVLAVRYRDHLRRTPEGWRLARRQLDVLWTEHRTVTR
ncbi:hypothetical protein BH10ACT1_BH10ACT1_34240 [soil metagenome]